MKSEPGVGEGERERERERVIATIITISIIIITMVMVGEKSAVSEVISPSPGCVHSIVTQVLIRYSV